ncbi:DUF4189 domain-containing protein [Xanthomonas arboricola]|nr:DUF4189 domain-containing protein [Xanthomonas arboricola]
MKKNMRAIPLCLAFISFGLFAQTACPVSVAPGSPQCGPDSGTSRGDSPLPPPRPTGEWIKTWGAIACSASQGESWTSLGKTSRADAESEAVNQCEVAGLSDCKLTLSYQNQCVSMASPPGAGESSAVSGKTKEITSRQALNVCEKINNQSCSVVYSACTAPIFKKY